MNTIMVPLDGSRFGEFALPYAIEIASRSEARIHIVHVAARLPLVPSRIEEQPVVEWADEYMDDVVRRIRTVRDVEVEATVLEGVTRDLLLERARNLSADLIVMTTHGRGGIDRAWLGSVADAVVRAAHVPVLAIRPEEHVAPDLAKPPGLQRILVATDGSEESGAALAVAEEVGRLMDGELRLVQVLEVAPVPFVPEGVVAPRASEDDVEAARRALEEIAEGPRSRGTDVDVTVRVDDRAFEGILVEADAWPADLVVVGTRGQGGAARLFMGSVADKVVRTCGRPVLVVPPSA